MGHRHHILTDGGTVVDAVAAAAAALTVVYPHMCSVGGDAIAILAPIRRRSWLCVNGLGAYVSDNAAQQQMSGRASMPIDGPLAVSVPGAV